MRMKKSPRVGCTPTAGTNDSAREIIAEAYPFCLLRGHRIINELPALPCPLREHNPADGLFKLKDFAFRKLGATYDSSIRDGLHDYRVHHTCDRCMEQIRACPHHREHVHWLRESLNHRPPNATPHEPEKVAIALPVYDDSKAIAPTNGKPVIEIAFHLTHRRRKPAHVR